MCHRPKNLPPPNLAGSEDFLILWVVAFSRQSLSYQQEKKTRNKNFCFYSPKFYLQENALIKWGRGIYTLTVKSNTICFSIILV
jgi:hypothetical protein